LLAVNESDPYTLWADLKEARKRFFLRLTQRSRRQRRFLRGWLNRLNDLKFIE
jgi:hypothetical protein